MTDDLYAIDGLDEVRGGADRCVFGGLASSAFWADISVFGEVGSTASFRLSSDASVTGAGAHALVRVRKQASAIGSG